MATRNAPKPVVTPPRWADRFLEWYCNPLLLDEIQGDAYELFYRRARHNVAGARWHFAWNVLRFFRWRNIRKDRLKTFTPTSTAMLRSYLITGARNMWRNATPSAINIIGLAVAIACAVLIFILEDSYYNLDAMHRKGDRIGLVVNHVQEGESTEQWARSPIQLADMLRQSAAVEKVVRLARGGAAVRVGDKVFNESFLYADADFLNMFSFGLVAGNPNCLSKKSELMISEEMARKYFGTHDVVGQVMSLKFNEQFKQEFTIGAVLQDTPANSSIYFSMVVPAAVWEEMKQSQLQDWTKHLSVTYVLIQPRHQFSELNAVLSNYQEVQNRANPLRPVRQIEIIPLPEVAQRSYDISGSLSWSNSPAAMIAFVVIGIFLLLLACFNYMNVAVASVSTRLKEIGVRKVIGGSKREIIQQFLVENVLLVSISLLLGLALAYYFLVPGFDALYPVKISFEVSSWKMAFLFFGGLLAFVALVSGAYPALYVASFNTLKILRGKEKFGSKSLFSKVLLTLQFILSITTMVGCLVFVGAGYYLEGKDWGYNRESTVVVPLQSPRQYEELRARVATHTGVVSYAGAAQHIGKSSQSAVLKYQGQEYAAAHFPVGFDYLESLNIRLKAGRFFDERIASDKTETVIVNEAMVQKMGWTDPLNEAIESDSVKRYVVGVVENFYYNDFYWAVEPAMFTIETPDNFRYFVVKAEAGAVAATAASLESIWKEVAPDDPYRGFLQSAVFDNFMNSNRSNNKVIYFISGVAVLLAAMGLYGLVSYNLTRRLKEFSVRKVFGAGVVHIFRLMNRDYLWLVLIAFVIGAPLGAFLMDMVIRAAYPEEIPAAWWPYAVSIGIMVLTVGLTVMSQLRRVTRENPTQTLRLE